MIFGISVEGFYTKVEGIPNHYTADLDSNSIFLLENIKTAIFNFQYLNIRLATSITATGTYMSRSSSIWDFHFHSYVLTIYVRLY